MIERLSRPVRVLYLKLEGRGKVVIVEEDALPIHLWNPELLRDEVSDSYFTYCLGRGWMRLLLSLNGVVSLRGLGGSLGSCSDEV